MKKALIILNDSLPQMLMGKSSNLAYALSLLEIGFETFIYILPQANFFTQKLKVIKISDQNLIKKYKEINYNLQENLPLSALQQNFEEIEIDLDKFDLVMQRLEPMKIPFPPFGKENFSDILRIIQKTFPQKIINLPIDLGDKEIVQEVDKILTEKKLEKIGIPSVEFRILDENFPQIFTANKMVLKPANSAQSVGIFSVEKCASGFDLQDLKTIKIAELLKIQIYKIKENSREIIEILLALQSLKSVKNDKNVLEKYQNFSHISRSEIIKIASNLYNDKILLQPFLEGVNQGDVRVLLLKNSDSNFYIAGNVFRKNARQNDELNFTTSYTSGAASAASIDELTIDEQKDLAQKCQNLVEILNENLREKYQNSLEIGADFILVGDAKSLLLGELNHTCPALLPIAESLMKQSEKYDGGLFYIKKAILDILERQNLNSRLKN